MEDFTTIIWVVIIIGAMIFNTLSKARKAQNKDGQAPAQHGEAWPSIPWDEAQDRETPSPVPNSQRPNVDPGAAAEHRDRGPIPSAAASTPNSRKAQGGRADETGSRSGGRVDETGWRPGGRVDETGWRPGGRVDETAGRPDDTNGRPIDTGGNPAGTGRRWVSMPNGDSRTTDQGAMGTSIPGRSIAVPPRRDLSTWDEGLKELPRKRWENSVSEDLPDECQSLEEEYLSDLDTSETMISGCSLDDIGVATPSGKGGSKGPKTTRTNLAKKGNPNGSRRNRPCDSEEESLAEIVEEFDLRRAVIYSEILKPKFEE